MLACQGCSSGIVCLNVVSLFQHGSAISSVFPIHQFTSRSDVQLPENWGFVRHFLLRPCGRFALESCRGRRSSRLRGLGKGACWSVDCAVPGHRTCLLQKTHRDVSRNFDHTDPNKMRTYKTCIAPAICEKERERESEWGDAVKVDTGVVILWSGDHVTWWWLVLVMTRSGNSLLEVIVMSHGNGVKLCYYQVLEMSSGDMLKCWSLQ